MAPSTRFNEWKPYVTFRTTNAMTRQFLRSSLQTADALSWREEAGYSHEAAAALGKAYVALGRTRSDPHAYRRAYAAVIGLQTHRLSLQQRMNVEFVLAQAYASEGDYPQAKSSAETALEITELLDDSSAQIELRFLRGSISQASIRLREACSDYEIGLSLLRELRRDDRTPQPVDPEYEIDLLIRLAGVTIELSDYDTGLASLERAHMLHTVWTPDARTSASYIAWLTAQLMRYHGELDEAVTTITSAANLLRDDDSPINKGRVQSLVAETALDRVEAGMVAGVTEDRETLLSVAAPSARRALALAKGIGDSTGAHIARLALLRIDRLRGVPDNRLPAIEKALRHARKTDDAALTGRALTALGDDHIAKGEREAARVCYRRAWRLLEEHELLSMAAAPRRAYALLSGTDDGSDDRWLSSQRV